MGLDMYLEKKSYVKAWNEEAGASRLTGSIQIPGIQPDNVTYVTEEVAYWRKANAIHRWFVENVQHGEDDCRAYLVTAEQLQELLKRVETVLAHPDMAEQILPTQEECFFGSTDYDNGYFDELKESMTILRWALTDAEEAEFLYQADW